MERSIVSHVIIAARAVQIAPLVDVLAVSQTIKGN